MKKIVIGVFSALSVLVFTGCLAETAASITSAYGAVVDERSTSELATDKKIEYTITGKLANEKASNLLDISADSFRGHVYLIGEYKNAEQRDNAIKIARATEGVKGLTTYLLPMKEDDTCGTAENLSIVASVKSRLVDDKEIWGTDVDVYSVQCNVVLVGLVKTSKEISKSIQHARTVEDVRSVKSYLKATNR